MSDEPEPFFSKDLHDHAVLALARVTWERDDAQIALKASKLVAGIAEEGLVRWKREAETAKAEIARLTSDLSDLEEVHETLKAETKRADYWKAKADEAKAEIVRLGEALTTALLYIDFEPIRPELEAILKPDTGEEA